MGGSRRVLVGLAAGVLLIAVLAACATQPGSITGTVTGADGIAVMGATVTAHDTAGAAVGSTTTGADGRYALVPLPPGAYRVEVGAPTYQTRWFLDATSFETATDVIVSSSSGTFADVTLPSVPPEPGSIGGSVTNAASLPIVGASVIVHDGSGAPVSTTATGDDGRYLSSPLPPGSYRVEVSAPAYQTRWYLDGTSFETAADVTVTAATASTADVVLPNLPPPPGSINGVVTAADRAPIAGATVTAHDSSGAAALTTTTGDDGHYELSPMAPASYRIEVAAATYQTRWFVDATSFETATDVTVSAATASTADVVLPTTPVPRPLRLGSASNGFGNQLNPGACPQNQPTTQAPCGPQPMVWAAINGPYTVLSNGDPYATKCGVTPAGQTNKGFCDNGGAPRNPAYRPTGYNYAIDVAPQDLGKPLAVEVYDATSSERTFNRTGAGVDCAGTLAPFNAAPYSGQSWTAQHCQTGDTGGTWNPVLNNVSQPGLDINELNMQFSLFQNDGSDLVVSYGGLQRNATGTGDCQLRVLAGINAATTGYKNAWRTVCTFTPTQVGIFPLRVQSSAIPGVTDNGDAFNAYSLRVSGGTATGLRPLDDVSTWSNAPGSISRLYLADVDGAYAGRTLLVDLFDLGDGVGASAFTAQLLAPPSGSPAPIPTSGATTPCTYNATPSTSPGPATPNASATCTVTTKAAGSSTGIYNGSWLRLRVAIPATYTCTLDCWWSVRLDFGSTGIPTDRTTWTVKVE